MGRFIQCTLGDITSATLHRESVWWCCALTLIGYLSRTEVSKNCYFMRSHFFDFFLIRIISHSERNSLIFWKLFALTVHWKDTTLMFLCCLCSWSQQPVSLAQNKDCLRDLYNAGTEDQFSVLSTTCFVMSQWPFTDRLYIKDGGSQHRITHWLWSLSFSIWTS